MKNELYIYHNLGLGDHIICNGLVRQKAIEYDTVFVFCKERNLKQVQRMFVDDPKIVPVVYKDQFIRNNPQNQYLIARPKKNQARSFDKAMYDLAGVAFRHKWDSFYVERNTEKEKELLETVYCINGDEFAFLHDDASRGYRMIKQLPKMRQVRSIIQYSVFDYMLLIERANEVHCMDSCFLNLIECAGVKQDGLFFHKYIRIKGNREYGTPTLKRNWRVVV